MSVELTSIPIKSIWSFLKWLPGFVLRKIFPKEKLANLIYIDIRPRCEPVTVNLGECASYTIWLQLINLSPFEVELDRGEFRFWCGGTIIKSSMLAKQIIPSGKIISLRIEEVIPDGHANQIAKNVASHGAALEGNIEFNCWLHPFAKNIGHLNQITPRFINETQRLAQE